MTNYLKIAVWVFVYVSNIALLCMWMKLSAKKRKMHTVSANITAGIVMVTISAAMCYVNYAGKVIITVLCGFLCFVVTSALLYEDNLERRQNEEARLEDARINYNEKYYEDLDKIHEQYDIFIHDMKHMMRTVNALAGEGRCKEIEGLIGDMQIKVGNIQNRIICSHKILNAMLTERKAYADECGAGLELEIAEPLYLQNIDDVDLITLVGNLLDNAIEAETRSHGREGVLCRIHMSGNGIHAVIQIENSYDSNKEKDVETGSVRSLDNIGNKHGIGLKSVKKVVRKYGGVFDCWQNDGRYRVKVILPVQANAENILYKARFLDVT